MQEIKLQNTRTKKLETFTPFYPKKVTIYVCGITPYDTTHLGHAFTYISFDALIRYLEFLGYSVTYTQNVTDINDRDTDILERAKEQDIPWKKLAGYWENTFLNDMKTLNWRIPDNYIKASEHLPAMISLIKKLLKNKVAYEKNKSIYLDVTKDKNYGSLSSQTSQAMLKKAKEFEEDIENPDKRNKLDITLWKAKKLNQSPHIPYFDSPFGEGRPGWHIECSAMAIFSLGEQIDIHGGGDDLIFPHHEAEIAQSENATGKRPFANFWLHTASVSYNGAKMSKSIGNLVLVSELLKKYAPNALRFFLLLHHYKKPWEYKEKEMILAQEQMIKIEKHLKFVQKNVANDPKVLGIFKKNLSNNLDIPGYLTWISKNITNFSVKERTTVRSTLAILGFT